MKRILYTLCLMLGWTISWGQTNERVYVLTDKDFYLSGEKMHLAIYGQDQNSRPLDLSKVVYVELLGDAFNAVRVKVEMTGGKGGAVVELPYMLSSGIYELVAYTRWMRNEGEEVFFRKPIGIYNSLRYSPKMDNIVFEDEVIDNGDKSQGILDVTSDKPVYKNREKVSLSLANLPDDACVSISVVRKDVKMALADAKAYSVKHRSFSEEETERLVPELEGMIIEGRYEGGTPGEVLLLPNLSVKGKDFHYYSGKSVGDNKYQFLTPTLCGMNEMVASVDKEGRMELISPFVATPPQKLQPLHLNKNDEKALLERSMSVQIGRFYPKDSVVKKDIPGIFMEKPQWTYNLDDYRRFSSFEETFLEFIPWLSTTQIRGRKYITIFDETTGLSNNGNTLVMLDGVTIMNHETLLKYNPYFVKWVDIYIGKYVFGNQMYDGIVTFRTPNHWMPSFQLSENSVVVEYEGVLPAWENMKPEWKNKTFPDFRHTLYWNPDVTVKDKQLECWTSDLCGTYLVKVEGMTKEGKKISGSTSFVVEAK